MPIFSYSPTRLLSQAAWLDGNGFRQPRKLSCNWKLEHKSEVEVVRTRITLECTECKHRNYNMTKDKKTHPERMETKKYCRFCKSHTLHKETK